MAGPMVEDWERFCQEKPLEVTQDSEGKAESLYPRSELTKF